MKSIQTKLLILLLIVLALPHPGTSQDGSTNNLHFEVSRIYPSISISKEELHEARTLIDLNARYKPEWVSEYISVEVSAISEGRLRTAMSTDENFSREQQEIMMTADAGTDIRVRVRYLPENTLAHNDEKEIKFSVEVSPESDASFPGGQMELNRYLKNEAIDEIPEGSFTHLQLVAVTFTVDEKGRIINAQVFESSKDDKTDNVLLEAIRSMPEWQPAEYANGVRVKQEFALMVGNMESCVVNLLNIRQD